MHFLAGSKFKNPKLDDLKHLMPYENNKFPEIIASFTCSPKSESETSFVNVLDLNIGGTILTLRDILASEGPEEPILTLLME